jgi:6-phosphogluconolactonase (cycloisomerase 2 family)
MKKIRFGLFLVLAAACTMLAVGAASAGQGVVGHVYVNDNTAGVNTIGAFDRHADGTLTPMPGSPFVAGGTGTGTGLASQGSLQRSSDGRYLMAVDAGSNQISVLRTKHDGSLKPVGGGPVSSNGVNPVSIAVHGQLVYVANAGTATSRGGTNYTGFKLSAGGHLRPLAGSTVTLPDASQPGDVLFSPDGRKLVGTRVATSLIDSFTVDRDGLLAAAPGSPFAAQRVGPFGSKFRPTNASQLYVSNAHDGAECRQRIRLRRRHQRRADHDRRVTLPEQSDGTLLGRDQPRRSIPVRREHRLGLDLELLDRDGRLAYPPPKYADKGRGHSRRRPPVAGRQDPLGRRPDSRHRQRLQRQRWQPHRASDLPHTGSGRCRAGGHRRHVTPDPKRIEGGRPGAGHPRTATRPAERKFA